MKFTLFYEIQLPTPHTPDDVSRMFHETLEHAALADALGFHAIWGTEHHFLDDHSLSSASEVWLAAAAARTSRIRIGHGIVCMPPRFRHPARIAESVSTLDQVSGGRVELGTGESSSRMELEGFGVDRATKFDAYLEAVGEVVKMMTLTPYPGHDGVHFSMPARNVLPKPRQRPHPPLWVASKPDVAARHGMGCLGFSIAGLDAARQAVDDYYRTLAEDCVPIGRTVNANLGVVSNLFCDRDAGVARELGSHLDFFGFSLAKYYLPGGESRPGRGDAWSTFLRHKPEISTPLAGQPSCVGTPEQVREHLRVLEDLGVDQVILMHQGGRMPHDANCASLELFAREVMPDFLERDVDIQRRKAARMEPIVTRALARRATVAEVPTDDIPVVRPYDFGGTFAPPEQGATTSDATLGALGLDR